MTAPALDVFSEDQWLAELPADEARAAVRRALDLSSAIASGRVGGVDNAQAAYLIRVAVFDSARGAADADG